MQTKRRRDDELVDIAATLNAQTQAAFLIHDGALQAWVPKSMVERSHDGEVFTMPLWLAKEKGFI